MFEVAIPFMSTKAGGSLFELTNLCLSYCGQTAVQSTERYNITPTTIPISGELLKVKKKSILEIQFHFNETLTLL